METKTDNEWIKWKEWEQEIIVKECLKCSIIQLFFPCIKFSSFLHISSLLFFGMIELQSEDALDMQKIKSNKNFIFISFFLANDLSF